MISVFQPGSTVAVITGDVRVVGHVCEVVLRECGAVLYSVSWWDGRTRRRELLNAWEVAEGSRVVDLVDLVEVTTTTTTTTSTTTRTYTSTTTTTRKPGKP